jgi:hypothetical protein
MAGKSWEYISVEYMSKKGSLYEHGIGCILFGKKTFNIEAFIELMDQSL